MKLVTWNIQWGCGLDGCVDFERIVRTARELADFDVLCVQEVADNFPGLAGNDERDQFAELGRLLPGFERAEAIAVDVPDEARRRRFGNAIYSRYEMLAVRRHTLPWPAHSGLRTMPRVAVEATLRSPIGPLRLTTTHLEYYSETQRLAQAARLRELHEEACAREKSPAAATNEGSPFDAAPQTSNAILTGDFNFRPDTAAYDAVQQSIAEGPRYVDTWRQLRRNEPHRPTFCLHTRKYSKEPYCCDFVFVSEPLVPRLRRIDVDCDTRASDHQPVVVEIDDR